MIILGIDPGTKRSGYVVFDSSCWRVLEKGVKKNEEILKKDRSHYHIVLVERISKIHLKSDHILETLIWNGRFKQHFNATFITRAAVLQFVRDKGFKGENNDKQVERFVISNMIHGLKSHEIQAMGLVLTYILS